LQGINLIGLRRKKYDNKKISYLKCIILDA